MREGPRRQLGVRPDNMKPKLVFWILCLHAGLLLLASTQFTVLSWSWGRCNWTWDYFQCSHRDGWGSHYRSEYSGLVVATYILAYAAGVVGHCLAWKRLANWVPPLGACLSALGLLCFLLEGSHWLWEHHLSWIVSCPAASLILAGIALACLAKASAQPPAVSEVL
jgi:hypothetical protein